jgi:RNA polymerase sigma factor (TIGR02999 family)
MDPRRSERATNLQLEALVSGTINPESRDALFELCRREIREAAAALMRQERCGHTLQPTALVNEAYLRLFDVESVPIGGRLHFVNIVVRAMRQVLVEHARRRNTAKRGGEWRSTTLSGVAAREFAGPVPLLDLHDALEKLADLDHRASRIVELRIFGGLTMAEAAAVIGVTRRTAQSDWSFAILWLRDVLAGEEEG